VAFSVEAGPRRPKRFSIRFSAKGKSDAVGVQVHDKVNDEVNGKEPSL
jgi:hypothetical protein